MLEKHLLILIFGKIKNIKEKIITKKMVSGFTKTPKLVKLLKLQKEIVLTNLTVKKRDTKITLLK